MKKKLLFVIDSLAIGGAEKSLMSLLHVIDEKKFEIDLMVFKKGGELEKFLPTYVNYLPMIDYFNFLKRESGAWPSKFYYYRFKTSLNLRINNIKKLPLHSEQVVYNSIGKIMNHPVDRIYDIAIAYSQGMPTYFVANRVKALKKMAWINTDYVNTLYDHNFDYDSYKRIDKIITVSMNTKDSVSKIREEYVNKVELILDIVDPAMIDQMASEGQVEEFDRSTVNILTVGRLESVKAFDKAIKVAKMLKDAGYYFNWFVVGEGSERSRLEELIITYGLQNNFYLLGKKLNPYLYMRNCDIYVQTSIKEGFGLTVSEAKILKKPIVCTNFPTAKEIITHRIDGLIVEHDLDSIYDGIRTYMEDKDLLKKIKAQLHATNPYDTTKEINKFYQLIES
ncbi:glycosyltransferase [Bacillus suaedae]|uniref:Glycosyltransferase n=1 Tax=Halalkalibacter suaedae TaxID=2822140 RepID=A0A940WWA8_9BACI|nr:glycosyltransferase [Bacillus suaedae]MBP3951513.1 glycosyltransferase [Bacillus suaedae]